MQRITVVNWHAGTEALESYSVGGLPDEELEEHMLVCDDCRERLGETETYLQAMRSAAAQLRRAKHRRGWMLRIAMAPQPRWAAGFAAVALAILAGTLWRETRGVPTVPLEVTLETTRGPEGAQAPAGRPLLLRLDVTDLPAFPSYRVEVVNATGQPSAMLDASPRAGRLEAPLSELLKSGVHFVRLYSPQQELLREYALNIKKPSPAVSRP
jgi:hypothetical protein